MSLVRPEYGPSLPELAAPRVRELPRAGRRLLAVLAALVVVALALLAVRGSQSGLHDVLVRKPMAFTLAYKSGVHRVTPQGDEVLRLEAPGSGGAITQTFTARPLTLGTYKGDVTADMLSIASTRLAELRNADPNLVYRGEGKARINFIPAYQLSFQTRRNNRLVFGKLFFLAPVTPANPRPTEGIELELISGLTLAIPSVTAVGANGALKTPLRSFRFGTARP